MRSAADYAVTHRLGLQWLALGDFPGSSGSVLSPIGLEIQSLNTQIMDSSPTVAPSSPRLVHFVTVPCATCNLQRCLKSSEVLFAEQACKEQMTQASFNLSTRPWRRFPFLRQEPRVRPTLVSHAHVGRRELLGRSRGKSHRRTGRLRPRS